MAGAAVKVVLLPAQIVKDVVLMVTDGVTDTVVVIVRVLLVAVGVLAQDALLVITNALLVAVVGLAQGELLAITTVTTLPFVIDDVVNVELFVPTLAPLIFH